ncbi:hypothetical protein VNI00_008787 [Paramarasmius palmivorus]|uniref:GPI inositol-deacylase n=1 Tax=Paramarasmius palmivorus TaxID=297713 RepID=A0AAW0CY06_9AGAR
MASPVPQLPVVLIHGLLDIPELTGNFREIERVLCAMVGPDSYLRVQIPPVGSIEERSHSAMSQIAAKFSGLEVHLIGHSMGGINARDIATKLDHYKPGFLVKTVTTMGTPHRGCKAIDLAPGHHGKEAFMKAVRTIIGTDLGAVGNLTARFMTRFNAETPDNPHVRYFSWAGQTIIATPLFILAHPVTAIFGPTDGVVNVESTMWGTHLGNVLGMDHLAVLSCYTIEATLPHLAAAERNQVAPVLPVDNNLALSLMRRMDGNGRAIANTATAPLKLLGTFLSPPSSRSQRSDGTLWGEARVTTTTTSTSVRYL